MSDMITPTEPQGSIVLYTTPDGVTQLDVKQYLVKGYAINQQRLDHYNELKEVS